MTKPEIVKVGYARVSTIEQNLDMQITALKQYGVNEAMIFTDKMSGAKQNRPGLETAIAAASKAGGEFVIWKLDRLGRTLLILWQPGLNGQPFPAGFRTSRLDKEQMADLITMIQEYGDRHQIRWSAPEAAA